MKITIEPETKEEKKIKKKVYENVVDFGLVGTLIEGKIMPRSFSHTHGNDSFVLIGKLEELKERIKHGIINKH